ncbi:hypothetical protein [Halodesulfovibrio spirochaetisodalis]|uniref:Molybdenum cofactor biosynthesis protein F N-terminal domain-containing protein n=1 Tax=Halodesulfovibrio spirochaetisodalis TaxID=1560234 RepID=A0A1B7X9V5_9BACT|nr:hypothetical protein [Halodesulfovibrio spirochaetisodalis]OBQ46151.1 hypothetical protein SP90_14135 [Halodesulfovibrio spirochaetisodalis]
MKNVFAALVLILAFTTVCFAAKKDVKEKKDEDVITVPQEKKVVIEDLIGKTIAFTWESGPFKDEDNQLLVVDPNTMRLSVESGMNMTDPSTIKFEVIQIDNEIFILTWRSEEYAQTLVMTLNFKTHMIYEVVVTEKANYVSQGPFILK